MYVDVAGFDMLAKKWIAIFATKTLILYSNSCNLYSNSPMQRARDFLCVTLLATQGYGASHRL